MVSYCRMTICKKMQRMKIISFLFGLAVVAASATLPAATVSVSSFKGTVYGPGEATLAFTDVDTAAKRRSWLRRRRPRGGESGHPSRLART